MKLIIFNHIIISLSIILIIIPSCDDDQLAYQSSRTYNYITVSIIPTNTQLSVSPTSAIEFTFSESINPSTFSQSFSLTSMNGSKISSSNYTVSYYNNNTLVILSNPVSSLDKDSIYTISLDTSLRSATGNPLQNIINSVFVTGSIIDVTPPYVTSHCVNTNTSCVTPSGTISNFKGVTINFSESMNSVNVQNSFQFTVNSSSITPSSFQWSNSNSSVSIKFPGNTPTGSCQYSLSVSATDLSGNGLSPTISANFTTN